MLYSELCSCRCIGYLCPLQVKMQNTFWKNIIPENDKTCLSALARYNAVKELPGGYFSKFRMKFLYDLLVDK